MGLTSPRCLVALVCLTGAVSVVPAVQAAGRDGRFSNPKYGVTVDAPPGWTLSLHTGYPDILAVLLHPSGSRISIAAANTALASARELAEQNRRALEAQGLSVLAIGDGGRGGAVLDAQSRTRAERVRQCYLLRPMEGDTRTAVVVTLTAPTSLLATMIPTLEQITARIAAEAPAPSATPAPAPASKARAPAAHP